MWFELFTNSMWFDHILDILSLKFAKKIVHKSCAKRAQKHRKRAQKPSKRRKLKFLPGSTFQKTHPCRFICRVLGLSSTTESMSDQGTIRIRTCSTLNAGMEMVNGQLGGLNLQSLDDQIKAASIYISLPKKTPYMLSNPKK